MASSFGRLYLAALAREPEPRELLVLPRLRHLFRNTEVEAFEAVAAHVAKFGRMPRRSTLRRLLGDELPKAPEPAPYYRDLMTRRYVDVEMKRAADNASSRLAAHPEDPEAALSILLRDLMAVRMGTMPEVLVDFRDAADHLLPLYASQAQAGAASGIMSGWPSFDAMSAGLQPGDVASIVGRPAAGKTFLTLWLALRAWAAGHPVLFVSMEMKPTLIMQRLAAIQTSTPIQKIMRAQLAKDPPKPIVDEFARYRRRLLALRGEKSPLWVLDGDLAVTVPDLRVHVLQLRPAVVFVDGAYLMGHEDRRLNRYARVAENSDMLKHLAGAAPIVASYQLNRDAARSKARRGDAVGLEHIGDSDAIGRNSSLVLGLFEEDSPETLRRRRVTVMKGRHGEHGTFHVRWDFTRMDFSEHEEEAQSLAFL